MIVHGGPSFQRSAVGFIGYKLVTLYHVILHNATPGGKLEDFVSHVMFRQKSLPRGD